MTEKYCRYRLVLLLLCFFCVGLTVAEATGDDQVPKETPIGISSATVVWPGESNGTGETADVPMTYSNTHAGPDPSGTPVIAPAVISTAGRYILKNDLTNSTTKTAILITASDVVFDGNGHTLGGVSAMYTSGVLAGNKTAGLENVTITNLTVTGWGYGIQVQGVTGSTLLNSRITGSQVGITLDGAPSGTVANCTVTDNIPLEDGGIFFGGNGIYISDSPGTRILDSTVSHNGWGSELPTVGGYGLLSLNNTGLLISGCNIDENVNTALWNQNSKDVRVLGNGFYKNGGNGGIFMTALIEDPVLNSTIINNTIADSGSGIWLTMNDHLVRNNTVSGCGTGILLDSSRNATLAGNVMLGNGMNFGVDGQDIEHFFHQVDSSNTVDGRPISYLVNQSGVVIDGATRAGTVYAISCPDLMIRDLYLGNNLNGVFLLRSDRAVITNVTATVNNNGYFVLESTGTRIEDCTALANIDNGFMIEDSEGVQITRSGSFMNRGGIDEGTGISVEHSRDILLSGVNTSRNNFAGIDLEYTDRAGLENVTADANGVIGIILGGGSIRVTSCHIRENQGPGIGMLDATGIIIQDNIFSNEVNVDLSQGSVTGSSWNTDKTAGTNIVGGPYLGGNYWASPDGTGFSQTHPDRGDGFCDEPYVLGPDNTDFLPLHEHPVAGMSGWVSSGSDYGPCYLPGIRVRAATGAGDLSIPGKYWEAVTDTRGVYTLTSLPSGVPLYATALSPASQPDTYYERPIQYQVSAGRLITCMNRSSTPQIPSHVPGSRAQVNWVLTRRPGNLGFMV